MLPRQRIPGSSLSTGEFLDSFGFLLFRYFAAKVYNLIEKIACYIIKYVQNRIKKGCGYIAAPASLKTNKYQLAKNSPVDKQKN
jgi:hypothetical protein